MKNFSHLSAEGEARMVDVGAKPAIARRAVASATLHCSPETIRLLRSQALPKGDVLAVARVAGIQAAKRTSELIPLCHALPLEQVSVEFAVNDGQIDICCSASTNAKTGVEMEALTAASITALTLYDMMKAVDSSMRIEGIRLMEKIKG